MNTEQMVYELWEMIGRPAKLDMDPTDGNDVVVATGPGVSRMLRVLDWAQTQVAAWRDPRQFGRPMWWSGAYKSFTTSVAPWEGLGFDVAGNLNAARWTANPPAVDVVGGVVQVDAGVDPLLEPTEDREIVVWDQANSTVIGYPAFSAVTTGRTFRACPRWLDLPRSWRARSVHQVKLVDTAGGSAATLTMAERGDQLNERAEVGTPTGWLMKGNRIWFDKALEETRYLRLECECAPATLMVPGVAVGYWDLTMEPELPEQFHGLIVLYAAAYGQGLLQDLEQQTVRRGQFRDDMMMTIDQADTRMDLDQGLTIKLAVK